MASLEVKIATTSHHRLDAFTRIFPGIKRVDLSVDEKRVAAALAHLREINPHGYIRALVEAKLGESDRHVSPGVARLRIAGDAIHIHDQRDGGGLVTREKLLPHALAMIAEDPVWTSPGVVGILGAVAGEYTNGRVERGTVVFEVRYTTKGFDPDEMAWFAEQYQEEMARSAGGMPFGWNPAIPEQMASMTVFLASGQQKQIAVHIPPLSEVLPDPARQAILYGTIPEILCELPGMTDVFPSNGDLYSWGE